MLIRAGDEVVCVEVTVKTMGFDDTKWCCESVVFGGRRRRRARVQVDEEGEMSMRQEMREERASQISQTVIYMSFTVCADA